MRPSFPKEASQQASRASCSNGGHPQNATILARNTGRRLLLKRTLNVRHEFASLLILWFLRNCAFFCTKADGFANVRTCNTYLETEDDGNRPQNDESFVENEPSLFHGGVNWASI